MTVFAVNFIAIVPLALLLGRAADESILRTGDVVGALINTTFRSVISLGYVLKGWCQASSDLVADRFSNAVQLITSILLLKSRQIEVLQTSLIGTILSSMH